MYSIVTIPDGASIPPIDALLKGRPAEWQGMRITWSVGSEPVPVFLASFRGRNEVDGPNVFLFGARYDLSEALLDGQSLGAGYFVEYFVVCRQDRNEAWALHRLLQRRSVTFSESDDEKDYVAARGLVDPKGLSIHEPPRWESAGDAMWPTDAGKPMTFLGQVTLPETELTRTLFTWGMSVYLFWTGDSSRPFKAVVQPSGVQSAEQHYQLES